MSLVTEHLLENHVFCSYHKLGCHLLPICPAYLLNLYWHMPETWRCTGCPINSNRCWYFTVMPYCYNTVEELWGLSIIVCHGIKRQSWSRTALHSIVWSLSDLSKIAGSFSENYDILWWFCICKKLWSAKTWNLDDRNQKLVYKLLVHEILNDWTWITIYYYLAIIIRLISVVDLNVTTAIKCLLKISMSSSYLWSFLSKHTLSLHTTLLLWVSRN